MKRMLRNGVAVLLVSLAGVVVAGMPQWWTDRGVVDTNAVPNDYAPVNQGQSKQVAYLAYLEFQQKLGTAGSNIQAMVSGFSGTNNYLPLNLGQLKTIVAPFYDRLNAPVFTNAWPEGMTVGPYPWSGSTNPAQDYAVANIGQLKYLFSFDFLKIPPGAGTDSDGDGLSDWFEQWNGWNPSANDSDGDGRSDHDEFYVYKTNPGNDDVSLPVITLINPTARIVVLP